MRPTATIVRVRPLDSSERRIRLRFRLLQDGVQVATLSGGKVQPDGETVEQAAPHANLNEAHFVRPWNGIAFGDGGEGGPAIDPTTHGYAIVVDVFDFDAGDNSLYNYPCFGDTDGDALSDDWETNGVDADGDGSIDVPLPSGRRSQPPGRVPPARLDAGYRLSNAATRTVAEAFWNTPAAGDRPGSRCTSTTGPTR